MKSSRAFLALFALFTLLSPYAVLQKTVYASNSAETAGYLGVELFISAKGVRAQELLKFAHNGPLVDIPNEGIISAINVLTQDGWIRIVGGF